MADAQTMTWWQRIRHALIEAGVEARDVDPLVRAVHPVVREIVKEARDS